MKIPLKPRKSPLPYSDAVEWCLDRHRETNHMYAEYLPYEFHLRMVAQVADEFKELLPPDMRSKAKLAAFGHDLIEDTRVSYNDVSKALGEEVADIIYALTNEKGKNRKERANDKYYQGIRETPGAVYVKLCDRIANVRFSKMTKSRMFEMYKEENPRFMESLGCYKNNQLFKMFTYLNDLFI